MKNIISFLRGFGVLINIHKNIVIVKVNRFFVWCQCFCQTLIPAAWLTKILDRKEQIGGIHQYGSISASFAQILAKPIRNESYECKQSEYVLKSSPKLKLTFLWLNLVRRNTKIWVKWGLIFGIFHNFLKNKEIRETNGGNSYLTACFYGNILIS